MYRCSVHLKDSKYNDSRRLEWIDPDGSAELDDPNELDGWAEPDGWMEGIGVLRDKACATKRKTQKHAK